MIEFALFDKNGKMVGYKRISESFGILHDYSYDGKIWKTPQHSCECLISHALVKRIESDGTTGLK